MLVVVVRRTAVRTCVGRVPRGGGAQRPRRGVVWWHCLVDRIKSIEQWCVLIYSCCVLFVCVVWCVVTCTIMLVMYYLNTLKLISIGVSAKLWLGGVWFGGQQNARGVCAAHRTIDRSCCTLQRTNALLREKKWNFFIVIVVILGLFSETFGNLVRYFDWSTTCCSQSISFYFHNTFFFSISIF